MEAKEAYHNHARHYHRGSRRYCRICVEAERIVRRRNAFPCLDRISSGSRLPSLAMVGLIVHAQTQAHCQLRETQAFVSVKKL